MNLFALALGLAVYVPTDAPAQSAEPNTLLVLAASSLTDVLPAIGAQWEDEGGVPLRFSFDATSRLAPQASAGAPADVFVSADEAWIEWLEVRNLLLAGSTRVVAENELVFVVPSGFRQPSGAVDLPALGRIALAGENVPAGRYAREALVDAGVWSTLENAIVTGGSVRGVLEWVARAEVDGGIVYRTDAIAEPSVRVAFSFSTERLRPVRYFAAALASSSDTAAARSFVGYLEGAESASAFRRSGFLIPSSAGPTQGPGAAPAAIPSVASAIRLSLIVALLATLVGLVPAVGLGWLLARHDFAGKTVVSTVVLAPLVIPPVVTGFLLLTLLGRQSALGAALAGLGLSVPFTVIGATIAAFVVGLPLYVLSVRGAFEAVDPLYEELSWTLGVPPRATFRRISIPLALPGIAAGAILAFARSLGEFGATVVLAGNVEGSTRTIALAVYTLLEAPGGRGTTWTLVGASVALSLLALFGYEALSRRQRRRVRDDHGL
ncbi:MAG: molybdate ABC transporter permease subunit [Gemmatimonadota bacterium]|nr:molybdate ABC transporter permease subunit [Gemmatimonadota bacterium]